MTRTVVLLLPLVLPVLLALLEWAPLHTRRLALAVAPWAAVPALLVALAPVPGLEATVPWLLLQTVLGVDLPGRLFLFFTALLWTVAGVHARTYVRPASQPEYFLFHLLALAGNLGLIVAQDLVSFYLFFALMTFSAYGLVVHDGTDEAMRAGRVYIILSVAGETMLLVAFLIAASEAQSLSLPDVAAAIAASPSRGAIVGLLLAGFGIKAGAVPLHVWLPLAHPVAPTPASAVLSGCMIKAGLLGWLRFLPLGEAALPVWGGLVIAAGLAAAFFGVLIGVTQRDPKTTLAYSSISQIGLINIAVGIGLADPAARDVALTAVPLYAMHHGLAKGALFLGVSIAGPRAAGGRSRALATAGLLLPAAALAGAPLTSGAIAKLALKDAVAAAPAPWPVWLVWLLPLAAVGTTLLMCRFLVLMTAAPASAGHDEPPQAAPRGLWVPWAALLGAVAVAVGIVPQHFGVELPGWELLRPYTLWTAVWPIAAGALIARAAVAAARGGWLPEVSVAPGDLLVPFERADRRWRGRPMADVPVAGIHGPADPVESLASTWYGFFEESRPDDRLARAEAALVRWETGTLLVLLLAAAFFVL